MASKNLKARMLQRSDTSTNWSTNNPVLQLGEIGFETDSKSMKFGDGVTNWNNLEYYTANSVSISNEYLDDLFTGDSEETVPKSEVESLIAQALATQKEEFNTSLGNVIDSVNQLLAIRAEETETLVANAKKEAKAETETLVANAKKEAKEECYPVGSHYSNETDSRNPAEILGFGTWEAVGAGRTLVAAGTYTENGETFKFTAGSTGGEAKHQLTVGELPGRTMVSLNPQKTIAVPNSGGAWSVYERSSWGDSSLHDFYSNGCTAYGSGDKGHNILQPYISVYLWKRTS